MVREGTHDRAYRSMTGHLQGSAGLSEAPRQTSTGRPAATEEQPGVALRTGADYRDSLRDGRRVWVVGEGAVDDVTTHPATRAMVDNYVAWYDRHFDPSWQDIVLNPADGRGRRTPVAGTVPRSADDLRRMGRYFSSTLFLSAGNVTHTPAYGNLIALGILLTVQEFGRHPEQVANAAAYRQHVVDSGRFLTFSFGAAPFGYRFRAQPEERAALRIVSETDAGVVLRGKVGMHTSPAFAEDVYIGVNCGVEHNGARASFVVPVGAPGVTVFCRKPSARHADPFLSPLSSRYDELDGHMWLDNVFVPWERVFHAPLSGGPDAATPDTIAFWLFWHQLYAWLAKAEVTLGLALACSEVMGSRENPRTIEHLVDLLEVVQTVRTCQTAAETDPEFTASGLCMPRQVHVASGSLAMLRARQAITETLRVLPGSSLLNAPSELELGTPEIANDLEESFGGGGFSALQRSALLHMAWDHVSSALDGRESAFELHANGGVPAWRLRLRRHFADYNLLANGVLRMLSVDMPTLDLDGMRRVGSFTRHQVAPRPSPAETATGAKGA